MVRVGKCKRCGRCCTMKAIMGSKGHKEHDVKIPKQAQGIKCPFLRGRVGKFTICSQYKNRPDFCRDYPADEYDLVKGCGFSFVKKEKI